MNRLTALLLLLLYPVVLFAHFVNRILHRDPLRIQKPDVDSFWILRESEPDFLSYFSQQSVAEGKGMASAGRIAGFVLKLLGSFYVSGRHDPGEKFKAAADRELGIPDEVYTLW